MDRLQCCPLGLWDPILFSMHRKLYRFLRLLGYLLRCCWSFPKCSSSLLTVAVQSDCIGWVLWASLLADDCCLLESSLTLLLPFPLSSRWLLKIGLPLEKCCYWFYLNMLCCVVLVMSVVPRIKVILKLNGNRIIRSGKVSIGENNKSHYRLT